MKRRYLIPIGILLLLFIGGAGYLGSRSVQAQEVPTVEAPPTVAVTRGEVKQTITAPGKLVCTRQTTLVSGASGRLAAVMVKPGQQVKAGQLLAQLDAAPLKQALANADVQLRLAQQKLLEAQDGPTQAQLADARATVRNAQTELLLAQSNYTTTLYSDYDAQAETRRYEYEWYKHQFDIAWTNFQKGETSQKDYDAAYNDMKAAEGRMIAARERGSTEQLSAQNRIDRARDALYQANLRLGELTGKPLTQTVMQAQLEVDRAQVAYQNARAALDATELRAPYDGVILSIGVNPGDNVNQGSSMMVLLDPRALESVTSIVEEDFPLIKTGQAAELFFDAQPDLDIAGRIDRVTPQSIGTDRPLYPVYIALTGTMPSTLVPGMTVDASIVLDQRTDVLRLPRSTVRAHSDGSAVVKVWTGTAIEERNVKVGLRGDNFVEILEGLQEGDQVVAQ